MKILKNSLWLCLILIITSCSSDTEEEDIAVIDESNSLTNFEIELLELVNEHRESQSLVPLAHDEIAYEAALFHTNYMIAQGKISHDNFSDRASDLAGKVSANSVAENVASRYNTAETVVDAWLNSLEGHRENIEGNFTHTAICARKDSNGDYFYTQLFYR